MNDQPENITDPRKRRMPDQARGRQLGNFRNFPQVNAPPHPREAEVRT